MDSFLRPSDQRNVKRMETGWFLIQEVSRAQRPAGKSIQYILLTWSITYFQNSRKSYKGDPREKGDRCSRNAVHRPGKIFFKCIDG
jgi:hypothetical protein